MREIKFRGKRVDNGEWVYGFLVKFENPDGKKGTFILPENYKINFSVLFQKIYKNIVSGFLRVNPETVGQYTGMKDKNGKEIYEGDIIDVDGIPYKVRFGQFVDTKGHHQCGFHLFDIEEKVIVPHLGYNIDEKPQWVVVGNIYENKGVH